MTESNVAGENVQLSEAKRSLLQKYLQGDYQRSSAGAGTIGRRPPGRSTLLSYEQQQIWLHCQLAPDLPLYTISLPIIDLRELPEAEREPEALRLATEEVRRPFDLVTGPLLRATLVRLADAEYRLHVPLHQIIFDGVSAFSVFLPELVALYDAF